MTSIRKNPFVVTRLVSRVKAKRLFYGDNHANCSEDTWPCFTIKDNSNTAARHIIRCVLISSIDWCVDTEKKKWVSLSPLLDSQRDSLVYRSLCVFFRRYLAMFYYQRQLEHGCKTHHSMRLDLLYRLVCRYREEKVGVTVSLARQSERLSRVPIVVRILPKILGHVLLSKTTRTRLQDTSFDAS